MSTEWETLLSETKTRLNCGYREALHQASIIYRRKAYYKAYYKHKREKEKLEKKVEPPKKIIRIKKKKIIRDTINNDDKLKLSPIIIIFN